MSVKPRTPISVAQLMSAQGGASPAVDVIDEDAPPAKPPAQGNYVITLKQKAPTTGRVVVTWRTTQDFHEKLRALADQHNTTVQEMITVGAKLVVAELTKGS